MLKCVVTGDGAVGKVRTLLSLYGLCGRCLPYERPDMPPHLLHDQCLSWRIHSYRVRIA